ncbi:MAG: hypothetical protein CFE26_21405, partial [Verrucomicrobiales bacterium VVV1]
MTTENGRSLWKAAWQRLSHHRAAMLGLIILSAL